MSYCTDFVVVERKIMYSLAIKKGEVLSLYLFEIWNVLVFEQVV